MNERVAVARILLVEDDPDLLFLLEHILRVEGHSINAVRTVSDALSLLECGFYDLAITDGRQPDGTGMMVGDKAVEKGVRVLILTGYAFMLAKEGLLRYPCLLKPVRPSE